MDGSAMKFLRGDSKGTILVTKWYLVRRPDLSPLRFLLTARRSDADCFQVELLGLTASYRPYYEVESNRPSRRNAFN
jgi:hypothetical protein